MVEEHIAHCASCCLEFEKQVNALDRTVALGGKPAVPPIVGEEDAQEKVLRFPGVRSAEAPLGEIGGYRIEAKIGEGGGGEIYRAQDPRLDRSVAIKFLRQDLAHWPNERARFIREAQILASLRHPHIVSVFDFQLPDTTPPFLVMEYVSGHSLAKLLEREVLWPPTRAVDLAVAIAQALAVAHERGLVHRDVKPGNILLDEAGQCPKLTDFGLARAVDDAGDLTRTGVIVGTPQYMSPEQIQHPQKVDVRTDVYSLGILLYQLLTGVLPFAGITHRILSQVINDDPVPVRHLNDRVPRDLETIVHKAIRKEPNLRYANAGALADDLIRWRSGLHVQAQPLSRVARWTRWCRRHPFPAGISFLVFTLLVVWTVGQTWAYRELQSAHASAEKAKLQAAQNLQLAVEQRDLALDALLSLVYESQDVLRGQPGMEKTRQMLLEKALAGFEHVSRALDRSESIDRGAVTAHLRLGEVFLALNDADKAAEHFDKAGQLSERRKETPQVLRDLTHSRWRLGDAERARQRPDVARVRYEQALALCERVARDFPADLQSIEYLAQACDRLGDLARAGDALEEARAWYARAWNELKRHQAPEREVHLAGLKLAQVWLDLGEENEARMVLQEASDGLRRLAQENAGPHARRDAALADLLWAELDSASKRHDAARQALLRALKTFDELATAQPNALQPRRDRAAVRFQLGKLALRKNDVAESRLYLTHAASLREDLAKQPGARLSDRQDWALALVQLALLEHQAQRSREAQTWHQKAKHVLDTLRPQVDSWVGRQLASLKILES